MTNEKAIEELKEIKSAYSNKQQFHEACLMRSEHEALDMAIKALEQEPCDDAISREAVLDELNKWDWQELYLPIHFKENIIDVVPPIHPQEPKTGHWIEKDGFDGDTYYDCSECGESWTTIEGTPWQNGMAYCPNCGARMVETQEGDRKCHTCKHYTSGEYDGSCDSYICKGYSDWESDNCN